MNVANDNGVTHFQRLDPNQIDVVLGSARPSRTANMQQQGRGTTWLLALVAVGIAAWGWLGRDGTGAPPPPTGATPHTEVTTDSGPEPVAVVNAAVSTRVVNQATLVIINPPAKPAPGRAATVEAVAPQPQPKGLVSPEYLAQFKAANSHPNTPAPRPAQIASVTLREWDGHNRYVARWRVQDEVIDQDSVCFNFPADSIDHRECRRAAQQYFRDQCKDWTRRAERDRDRQTREARTQLCGVAQSFTP